MRGTGRDSRPSLDLVAATLLAFGSVALTLAPQAVPFAGTFRLLVGLPFLLLAPGYVVVTALYPRTTESDWQPDSERVDAVHDRALDGVERLILSVAGSLALVGAVTLAANFTPWGIRGEPVVVGLGAVTLLGAVVAFARRRDVEPAGCPDLVAAVGGTLGAFRGEYRSNSVGGAALNLVVVVCVVVALAGVGYAAHERPAAEQYSEFAVLTEDDDGELSATGHPSELARGEDTPLFVHVVNHEGERTNYTAVVRLERLSGDDDPTVVETVELDRVHVPVDDGSQRTVRHTVSPELTGENLRLTYLFYEGAAPETATRGNSDETLQLLVSGPANGTE